MTHRVRQAAVRFAAALAVVAAAVTICLAAAMPAAAAARPAHAPGMIGQGDSSGDSGQGGSDPSSAWISLIPATSTAIEAPPAADPQSSVWISLIPATSSAVAEAGGGAAASRIDPSIAVSGTSSAVGEGAVPTAGGDGSRDPAVGHVQPGAAASGPLSGPAPAVEANSAGRWAAISAGALLVVAGATLIVLRARRLRHR